MEFVATIETRPPGDPVESAEALLDAADAHADGLSPTIAASDQGGVMLSLWVDGSDAHDVLTEIMELWTAIWEQAFPGLASPMLLVVGVRPQDGSRPRPDSEGEERPSSAEAELERENADLDAEIAAEA